MKDWELARYEDAKLGYVALMKFYPFTLEGLDGEVWRPVVNYEELYHVSNFARIKRFYKNGKKIIIKPVLHSTGRLFVKLWKDGKSKSYKLHRLVALAFLANPNNLPEINHIDTHPLNCHVSNLEWSTSSDNHKHAVASGLIKTGENRYNAKLTNAQVLYIRNNPEGLTTVELAEKFNVDQTTISNIQLGKSYKQAGGAVRQVNPRKTRKSLTEEEAIQIQCLRTENSKKYSIRVLAKMFEVGATTIRHVLGCVAVAPIP